MGITRVTLLDRYINKCMWTDPRKEYRVPMVFGTALRRQDEDPDKVQKDGSVDLRLKTVYDENRLWFMHGSAGIPRNSIIGTVHGFAPCSMVVYTGRHRYYGLVKVDKVLDSSYDCRVLQKDGTWMEHSIGRYGHLGREISAQMQEQASSGGMFNILDEMTKTTMYSVARKIEKAFGGDVDAAVEAVIDKGINPKALEGFGIITFKMSQFDICSLSVKGVPVAVSTPEEVVEKGLQHWMPDSGMSAEDLRSVVDDWRQLGSVTGQPNKLAQIGWLTVRLKH